MKQPRRKFGPAFKAEVALEAIKGIESISEIAQHHGTHQPRARPAHADV